MISIYIACKAKDELIVPYGSRPVFYGDSITFGQGASITQLAYANLSANEIGGQITNHAVSGRGIFTAINKAHNTYNHSNNYGLCVAMVGYNDLRLGNDYRFTNKEKGGHRIILSSFFQDTYYYYSDFTASGSWAASYSTEVALKGTSYKVTGGGSLTKTVTGSNFSFCFLGSNGSIGYEFGTFTINVDGTDYHLNTSLADKTDGLQDGAYVTPLCPYMVNVFGLSDTSHTITISFTGNCVFNYMQTLCTPTSTRGALILSPLHNSSGTWAGSSPYNHGSDAVVDAYSLDLDSVIAEYTAIGFVIRKMESYNYCPIGDLGDGIHPVDRGHYKLFQGVLTNLKK